MHLDGSAVAGRSQRRLVDVQQGLFALRYISSTAGPNPPAVTVEPGRLDSVTLIAAPGAPDRVLDRPGSCLLIRAERPARLTLTASECRPGASLDASLSLERVAAAPSPVEGVEPRLDLVAHIARRGDQVFQMGEWICGPQMPSRIEGLAIEWPGRPADVDLRYLAVGRGRTAGRAAELTTGGFAGSRGQAAPIVRIEIGLIGAGAHRYRLSGEALFLGSPIMVEEGAELRFASSTGRDPLVGLRITLRSASRAPAREKPSRPPATGAHRTGRVRMFREAAASAA